MSPAPTPTSKPVLLTARDAKRCARRVHNEWDPSIETAPMEIPPTVQMRFDTGTAFEATVFAELQASLSESQYADLTDVAGKSTRIAATLRAMDDRVEVIIGGWLPDDFNGGRTGRPDLLLRRNDGYVAGDVKAHKVIRPSAKGTLTYSTLSNPAEQLSASGHAPASTTRIDDYLQLAHYWRMLEAIHQAPPDPASGFIIGTDQFAGSTPAALVLTWMDLEAALFETFSRSQGSAKRSAMERYDHEQGFRLKVAVAAASGQPALIQPIFTAECDSCPWYDYCRELTGEDAASAHITTGRLSIREWQALNGAGALSVSDLADLDVDDESFHTQYLPQVTHVRDPIGRLKDAVRRARMIRAGVTLERNSTAPIDLPRADVEVDFDIEWDPMNRVYLWGALISRPRSAPEFRPVVSWDELDDQQEIALADTFATWLRSEIAEADAAGLSLRVYHYSNPEPEHLKRLLGAPAVADLLGRFVDLLPIIREHYFGLRGLGVKQVGPAFGFHWRDGDPGGLQSQLWLIEAREADDPATRSAAHARILAYNEDDVRATAAIRNGLAPGLFRRPAEAASCTAVEDVLDLRNVP